MKSLALASEVARIDHLAQERAKIPALCLMESAGLQIFLQWKPYLHVKDRLVFLCGGGNNGGDALVVARYAYNEGYTNILLIYTDSGRSESCSFQREIAKAYGLEALTFSLLNKQRIQEELESATWIVDGLVGTGLKGKLKNEMQLLVNLANESKARIIAIDVPSAVGDEVSVEETHIQAELTITMGHEKLAMYHPRTREACGQIIEINPSFPPFLLSEVVYAQLWEDQDGVQLKKLARDAYKNVRGHVAIFAGSRQYSGAARLSAKACFAARAGLVSLFCDEEVFPIAAAESPSVIVNVYQPDQKLDRYHAILAGPGWGEGRDELLAKLFESRVPMVLDADGIRAYAAMLARSERPSHGPLIITPHLGELALLVKSLWPDESLKIGKSDSPLQFFSSIQILSETLQATLVVKSSLTYIVTQGELPIVVESRNPTLGVAGSGDVLAGIIVALLGQHADLHQVALKGSVLHMLAGKRAKATFGYYDSETLASVVGTTVLEAEK